MAEEVKRSLKVQFSATGQAKLAADVDKVDRGLTKAGKDGTKALGDLDNGLGELSKGLAEALDPLDKAFAASDKLFSILGKAGAVGAAAAAGFELVKAALSAFTEQSIAAEVAAEAQRKTFKDLEAVVRTYSGALSLAASIEMIRANDDLSKSIGRAAEAANNAVKWEGELEGLRAASSDAYQKRIRSEIDLETKGLGSRARVEELREQEAAAIAAETIQRNAIEGAKIAADRANKDVQRLSMQTRALTEEAVKASTALFEPFGPEDAPGSATGGPARMAAGVDALALALAQLDEGPVSRAFEALREMAGGMAAQNMASATSAFDGYARALNQAAGAMSVIGEETANFWDVQKDAPEALSMLNDYLDAQGKSFAALAYEMAQAGATLGDYVDAVAKRVSAEAAIEALFYTAKAAVAGAMFLFTGLPEYLGAAQGFALGAAGFAAIGGAAAGIASSVGGGGGGGGATAGPGAGGSAGLTGASGSERGPTNVYLNFSGPAAGIGKFLAAELNTEANTRGGARLDSRIFRGG